MSYEFNKNLGKRLGEAIAADAVSAAAFHIQKVAKQLVNRGRSERKNGRWVSGSTAPEPPFNFTGNLQRSIQVDRRLVKGPNPTARVGPDGKVVPYAARLEFGFVGTDKRGRTVNQPARPYMRRALNEGAKKANEKAMKAAQDAVRRFARSAGGR